MLPVPFYRWRHEEERLEESRKATSLQKGGGDFHSCAPSSAPGVFDICIHGSEGSLRGAARGREKGGGVQIQRKKHKFSINGLYMIHSLHGNHQLQVAKKTPKQKQTGTNKSKPQEKKKFLRRTTAQDHAAWETSAR